MISHSILLRMRNVSNKSCRENQNTYLMFNFFSPKNHAIIDNVGKYGRARLAKDDNIIRCMRFACWITKTTDTHTQKMQHLPLFHSNNRYVIQPQCYLYIDIPRLVPNYFPNCWYPCSSVVFVTLKPLLKTQFPSWSDRVTSRHGPKNHICATYNFWLLLV